jgi:Ca-activated chloride channel family protein
MNVTQVYPDPVPDLFVGRPVILAGRFQGEGRTTVRIRGLAAGRPVEYSLQIDLNDAQARVAALPFVWARAKISELYDRIAWVGTPGEMVQEIRSTALQFGLLSEYTAFVAVDSSRVTEGKEGTTVPVPVPVPKGVKYGTSVERK